MYRQIRAYEETAQLIESLVRISDDKKFADVLEDWARRLYPDAYSAIREHVNELDSLIQKDREHQEDNDEL